MSTTSAKIIHPNRRATTQLPALLMKKLLLHSMLVSLVGFLSGFGWIIAIHGGWQPHTARAAISTLRKSGLSFSREGTDKRSAYRIA